jgi:hypothetical protein
MKTPFGLQEKRLRSLESSDDGSAAVTSYRVSGSARLARLRAAEPVELSLPLLLAQVVHHELGRSLEAISLAKASVVSHIRATANVALSVPQGADPEFDSAAKESGSEEGSLGWLSWRTASYSHCIAIRSLPAPERR